MPIRSGGKLIAFAKAVISIIVFEPSSKLASIFGFIFFLVAFSKQVSGFAVWSSGLFFPFPTHTISKPKSTEKSYNSLHATGSSPFATL